MKPLDRFSYFVLGAFGILLIALTVSGGTICIFNIRTGISINIPASVQYVIGALMVSGAFALLLRGDNR